MKITISIEDQPLGKVKIVSNPSFKEMVDKEISGNGLTSAQGYAIALLNFARKISQDNVPNKEIPIIGGH